MGTIEPVHSVGSERVRLLLDQFYTRPFVVLHTVMCVYAWNPLISFINTTKQKKKKKSGKDPFRYENKIIMLLLAPAFFLS